MKKIMLSIIALVVAFLIIPTVNAEEKVPVYIFTKEGCPACESSFEYFDELEEENPDLFDQYIIEVYDGNWNINDQSRFNLLIASLTKKGGDTEKIATPTIFIGDFFTVGLPSDTSQVYDAIVAARDAEEKVDVVKSEADTLGINLQEFKKAPKEKKDNKYDTIIVVSIVVVLIGGFVGLIVISKK